VTLSHPTNTAPYRGHGSVPLRFVLWLTQIVLAFVFGMAGWMKATYPLDALAMYVPWSPHVPELLVRFIGTVEFLGAIGLILPSLTRIKPMLTPLAAALLSLTMIFAIGFHLARGETHAIVLPLMLGTMGLFVAWGRGKKAPIKGR
jgi:putative oxidoreductase